MKFGPKETKELNEYLRTGRNRTRQFMTDLVDDLEPGSLKDELLKDFDPSQETYEEYLQRKNLERPFNAADGGRIGFYPGGSVEEFGQQIKDSYLKGKSITKINEELFPGVDKTTTIDSFIDSSKKGLTPVKITEKELATRPVTKQGRGQAGEALKRLQIFIQGFEKDKGRLPSSQELRRLGNFDFYTIKNAVEAGEVNILDATTAARIAQQESQGVNKQLLELSKDKDINNIFKTGKTSIKDIKKVKKVIGDVSNSVAADRLLQLASIYAETGAEDDRGLNIKPKYKTNASKILNSSPYTGYIRNMYEALIGKSVGEPSIKGTKSKIVQDPNYIKTNIAKAYDIDEPLGVASSVNRASTPYGIYGQIIDKTKNKMKVGWDARKSQLELELQEAIQSKNKKLIDGAVKKFNKEAKAAEKLFNKDRIKGTKKIVIPEVSLDRPNKTIANYKNLSDDYKKAFDAVHSNQGYSFKIPADLKPIPQIRKDLKDPKILSTVKESADLGAGRIYANPFFSPGILKEAFKQIPTPAGAVALNLGLGVDPTSAIDRASIAAEAAFAPALVKQAAKLGSVGQRISNLGLTPAMAARAARIASPIGIASLGAEGLYQAGKFTKKRIDELRSMTPEQRAELRRQGEAQAFDPFQAAGGGIAKQAGDPSGAPPEKGPNSQGLPGLLKRVRNY